VAVDKQAADQRPGEDLPPIDPRIASYGSRFAALLLDWLLANLIAWALLRNPAMYSPPATALDLAPLTVFAIELVVFTGLTGGSLGQLICGIGVARLDGQRVGLWRALVRTLLILLVIPPLAADAERRGLHDKAVGTVVLYRRGERAKLPR